MRPLRPFSVFIPLHQKTTASNEMAWHIVVGLLPISLIAIKLMVRHTATVIAISTQASTDPVM